MSRHFFKYGLKWMYLFHITKWFCSVLFYLYITIITRQDDNLIIVYSRFLHLCGLQPSGWGPADGGTIHCQTSTFYQQHRRREGARPRVIRHRHSDQDRRRGGRAAFGKCQDKPGEESSHCRGHIHLSPSQVQFPEEHSRDTDVPDTI